MEQPEGFESTQHPHYVCKLYKALYGLKQAPREWNSDFDEYIKQRGFIPIDSCIYIKTYNNHTVILSLYFDDILIFAPAHLIPVIKKLLFDQYLVKDMGAASSILGMEVSYNISTGVLTLRQRGIIDSILECANMTNCRPTPAPLALGTDLLPAKENLINIPYHNIIGKLIYLALSTHPDITHAVSYLSKFNTCYGEQHWQALKHVIRYLQGTKDFAINYKRNATGPPFAHCDSDWAGASIDRKSTFGFIFFYSGGPISWTSRSQRVVALSTTEAEFIALSEATKQALYLRKFYTPLGLNSKLPTPIHNDNQSALTLAISPPNTHHNRTKHIDIRYMFICDEIQQGTITVHYTPTDTMLADLLTKPLSGP